MAENSTQILKKDKARAADRHRLHLFDNLVQSLAEIKTFPRNAEIDAVFDEIEKKIEEIYEKEGKRLWKEALINTNNLIVARQTIILLIKLRYEIYNDGLTHVRKAFLETLDTLATYLEAEPRLRDDFNRHRVRALLDQLGPVAAKGAPEAKMRWVDRPKEWKRGKAYRSPSQFILDQYGDLYEKGMLDEEFLAETDPELLKAYKDRIYSYKSEKLPKLTRSLTPTEKEIAREAPGVSREKIKRWGMALIQQDRRRHPQ